MLGKLYKKLNSMELTFCYHFIQTNQGLAKGEFEFKVNRMFLDYAGEKPKHWKEILELLTCANSKVS